VYVPKKVEVPIVSPLRARPRSIITIGSKEALVTNHNGPIIIRETAASKQDEVPKELLEMRRRNVPKEIPSIANPCGVLVG
jgi:hypothetical protein